MLSSRWTVTPCMIAAAFVLGTAAAAQTYPSKPIRWIVPYPPGGGSDFFARAVAEKLSAQLGQRMVIDNRPGAATMIGAHEAATSPPDGYTVLQGDGSTYAINPSVYKKMTYDPKTQLAPVSLTARFAMLLVVNPTVIQVNSVKQFIDRARKEPGKLSYASVGTGTPHHLAMELFQQKTGIQLLHVPYKGAAPAVQDLLGGHLPAMFLDMATAAPHLKSGRLKALGVAADKRIAQLPDVPTIREAGVPGFEAWAWQGLSVPAGTPKEVIAKLNAEYQKAIADPAVRQKLVEAGIEPVHSTPEQMAAYIASETAKWAKVIKAANITAD
jgi:tripartite-type tricarboxylate transporter receptor subunit TctC